MNSVYYVKLENTTRYLEINRRRNTLITHTEIRHTHYAFMLRQPTIEFVPDKIIFIRATEQSPTKKL